MEYGIKRDSYLQHLSQKLKGKPLSGKATLNALKLLNYQDTFPCTCVAGGDAKDKVLTSTKLQKPGLGLAGHLEYIEPGHAQLLGRAEITYLNTNPESSSRFFLEIARKTNTCFIIARDSSLPDWLIDLANEHMIPLLRSPLIGREIHKQVSSILERELTPRVYIHGNFISVFELGVLILGKSGVGKSECALDLLMRGQRLISDDMVYIHKNDDGKLVGYGDDLTRYHMEIRGLGVINVRELFSIAAVSDYHELSMVIYLEKWDYKQAYDSLGLEVDTIEVLGTQKPLYRLPVAPGRNLANLIEVAVRNHYLKGIGTNPVKEIIEKLDKRLSEPPPTD